MQALASVWPERGRGTDADGVTRSWNRCDVTAQPEVVDSCMSGMDSGIAPCIPGESDGFVSGSVGLSCTAETRRPTLATSEGDRHGCAGLPGTGSDLGPSLVAGIGVNDDVEAVAFDEPAESSATRITHIHRPTLGFLKKCRRKTVGGKRETAPQHKKSWRHG